MELERVKNRKRICFGLLTLLQEPFTLEAKATYLYSCCGLLFVRSRIGMTVPTPKEEVCGADPEQETNQDQEWFPTAGHMNDESGFLERNISRNLHVLLQ